MTQENTLLHYGVKGMRWGVRRKDTGSAEPPSADAQKVTELLGRSKTSGTNALTNAELQAAISRMNLEQQFSRLVEQTTPKSAGRKFAEALLGEIGKEQVSRVAKAGVSIKVEDALTGEKKTKDELAIAVGVRVKPKKK